VIRNLPSGAGRKPGRTRHALERPADRNRAPPVPSPRPNRGEHGNEGLRTRLSALVQSAGPHRATVVAMNCAERDEHTVAEVQHVHQPEYEREARPRLMNTIMPIAEARRPST